MRGGSVGDSSTNADHVACTDTNLYHGDSAAVVVGQCMFTPPAGHPATSVYPSLCPSVRKCPCSVKLAACVHYTLATWTAWVSIDTSLLDKRWFLVSSLFQLDPCRLSDMSSCPQL